MKAWVPFWGKRGKRVSIPALFQLCDMLLTGGVEVFLPSVPVLCLQDSIRGCVAFFACVGLHHSNRRMGDFPVLCPIGFYGLCFGRCYVLLSPEDRPADRCHGNERFFFGALTAHSGLGERHSPCGLQSQVFFQQLHVVFLDLQAICLAFFYEFPAVPTLSLPVHIVKNVFQHHGSVVVGIDINCGDAEIFGIVHDPFLESDAFSAMRIRVLLYVTYGDDGLKGKFSEW